MSDHPKPKLPPNIPVLVVDAVLDTATKRFAFTTHAGCDRAKAVAEALEKGEDVPMPGGRSPYRPRALHSEHDGTGHGQQRGVQGQLRRHLRQGADGGGVMQRMANPKNGRQK